MVYNNDDKCNKTNKKVNSAMEEMFRLGKSNDAYNRFLRRDRMVLGQWTIYVCNQNLSPLWSVCSTRDHGGL